MKPTSQPVFDVFLSHAVSETLHARQVAAAMRAEGLEVFKLEDLRTGASIEDAVWEALAECLAVVAIVPANGPNANMTFELGAARAWKKPIYFLASDLKMTGLGSPFLDIPVYPLSRVDDVVRAIKSLQELTDEDRAKLTAAYAGIDVPLDNLLTDVPALDRLAQRFQRATGKSVPAEVLVSELLRMRKKGGLTGVRNVSRRRNVAGKA
jgi:hypothetical protein